MKPRLFATTAAVALAVTAMLYAAFAAAPVRATPNEQRACNASGCHTGKPSGNVTAKPSKVKLAKRAKYTVSITIDLSSGGGTGYWIAKSTASGATGKSTGVFAGPGSKKTWKATMKAPAKKGTYYYKVFGVKGAPSSGQMSTATYHITVK